MLNYNHLFYFHVAASEGSVARAAERLGVTQPTVSEQIRQLERTLGLTLFERTRSGIRLTDVGRQAFEHTSVMFRAGEQLVDALGRPETEEATVRIGVSWPASRAVAPDFLHLLVELDGFVPSVRRGELPDLLAGLRQRRLDLVLAEAAPVGAAKERLRVVDVCRPRLVAIAAPELAVDGDWDGVPLVHHGPGSIHRAEVDEHLRAAGLRPRVIAFTDDPMLMLAGARRGTCVAFVPEGVARDAIAGGEVRMIAQLAPGPMTVRAVHHDPPPEPVRHAVSALVAAAGGA